MKQYRTYTIVKLNECPEKKDEAAAWFHEKWKVPEEAYRESMEDSFTAKNGVPGWYLCLDGEKIIGGMGIIENDFHNRPDLTPNLCAVYTEPDYRCQGIAGTLLNFVCEDMKALGTDILYLLTEHDSFYERYGWEFYVMVQGDGEEALSRMYIHREK